MAFKIHPTALVDSKADLADGVEIGPHTVIGPHVKIGRGTKIFNHVTIEGYTQIGEQCLIYTGACLGTSPQVRKIPSRSYLKIGDHNIFREYTTVNPSMTEEGSTIIGNKNFIMINAHIAHDCVLGNEITVANGVGLAGHVKIEDQVVIGGLTGVHQFVRVGKYSMIGGVSKLVMDVPPFCTCDGHPARFYGMNALGLKRAGFSPEQRQAIRSALKILLASGKKISNAIQEVQKNLGDFPEVQAILEFIKSSKRGVVRASKDFLQED